ncbi:MAG TPA: response regulator, partial [Gemmatimonadales bacterium]|nr:response regulator [Gemmatimonadales bacterium]
GGIAHDFNNLLMGVLGNANLARLDLAGDSPVLENVEHIETAALRAAELTKQMLAYSGKGQFVIQALDLSEVVQEMVHLLGTVVSKKASLRLELAKGLPAVEADATQVRQVAMNLITNASDALADGPGVITLTTGVIQADRAYLASTLFHEGLEPGEFVFVEVKDTGCGMTAETRTRMFDPFFTTKFAGRGLGLAAVLGIVRGHHGAIRLESEPGRGTTFRVLFPSAGPIRHERGGPELEVASGSLQGRTVLVVDDEQLVREAVTRMLARIGVRPITVATGTEALRRLERDASVVDVVLLDMMMPEMNGEETFEEIHRLYPALPVILSSGYDEVEGSGRAAGHGLAGFIHKPYRLGELQGALERVLAD